MGNFTESEVSEIALHALRLMENGYFSGINRINFPFESKENEAYFIFHYLHDNKDQFDFIKSCLPKGVKGAEEVLRETYYLFDPSYASKPNFLEEYASADFRRRDLSKVTIDDVVKNPEGVIVANKELDFVIAIKDNEEKITKLAESIYLLDKRSPNKWIHPAMILRGEKRMNKIPNFVHKKFMAIKKESDMFYAVIFDRQRFAAMKKYISKECRNIQKMPDVNIDFGMIIYNPCQINKEFNEFMKSNLYELRPLHS